MGISSTCGASCARSVRRISRRGGFKGVQAKKPVEGRMVKPLYLVNPGKHLYAVVYADLQILKDRSVEEIEETIRLEMEDVRHELCSIVFKELEHAH